jgi:hypothetical protein
MSLVWNPLPQEILLLISEFGQVAPGLNPELIDSRMRQISPQWNWCPELKIQQLRRDNRFYPCMEPLIDYCRLKDILISHNWDKGSVSVYDINGVIPSDVLPNHPELRVSKRTILGSTVIVIEVTYNSIDLMLCVWLHDPRIRSKYNIPDNPCDISDRNDLSVSINSCKQSRVRSQVDMISEILKIQPKFNLGELIHRIELIKSLMVENTCPDMNNTVRSLYSTCVSRIIRQGVSTLHIKVVSGTDYSDILKVFSHCCVHTSIRSKYGSPSKVRITVVVEGKDELDRFITSSEYIEAVMGRVARKRVRWRVENTDSCRIMPVETGCICNIM